MQIFLLDRNPDITQMWKLYFSDIPDVKVVCDNFTHFMEAHDVECIVSPANSYGLMDGGYDAAISDYFGKALIPAVQAYIREHFFCEQPVGTSFIIDIPNSTKKLIHTPTMRIPSIIKDPLVVYQCMRTTLICAMQNNVKSIVIPAFGGHCGGVSPVKLALLMRAGYEQLQDMPEKIDWNYASLRAVEKMRSADFPRRTSD